MRYRWWRHFLSLVSYFATSIIHSFYLHTRKQALSCCAKLLQDGLHLPGAPLLVVVGAKRRRKAQEALKTEKTNNKEKEKMPLA